MAGISQDDSGAVVIIGSGAGGGTLAHELTRRGIKVVLLEAGARQSLETFSQVPGDAFCAADLAGAAHRFRHHDSGTGLPDFCRRGPARRSAVPRCIGPARPRASRPWEVRAHTTYGDMKGASLIDWPIEYSELEHYYQLAEKRMVVTRRNGVPGLPASNHFKVMYNGARRIGYKRVHTNYMAINTRPADGRGVCIQQGFCVQGCKTGAKWSTLYTEIPRAEATGNLDLRTQCRAMRIEHGANGLVSGVVYRDPQGREQRQKARIVCVACNSVETARLLLLSESARFPMDWRTPAIRSGGISPATRVALSGGVFNQPIHFWRGTTLAGIIEDETRHDPQRGFAGGYHLEMAALDLPSLPLAGLPSTMWGRDLAFVMEHYRNLAGIFINGEDMPRATNRITLNSKVKDGFGLPVANIHMDDHDNNAAMRAHAQRQSKALYEAVAPYAWCSHGKPQPPITCAPHA